MFDSARIAVLVKEIYEPTFWKTFEQQQAFWRIINSTGGTKRATIEKDITWKLYVAGTPGAGSFREGGSIGITRNDLGPVHSTARLGWALNKVPIKVSGLSQAISRSPQSIVEAAAVNTSDAMAQLQKNMNRQLLADGAGGLNGVDPELSTSGDDITGIQAAWDDGSRVPTYAGISRATNLFWRSFVIDNGGVNQVITEESMHQMLNELEGIREATIDKMTCSLGVFTQVGIVLGNDRRFNFTGSETPKFRGGFTTLHFNDKEINGVPLYQGNRMDFWDSNLLQYHVLLDFTIEERDAGDADAMVMFAKTYSQLAYRNCFHSGSLRDITSS